MQYKTQYVTWLAQEQERGAKLLRELPGEVERDAAEVGVAEQVVQVVREQLEHQAQVVSPHEVALQFYWNTLDYFIINRFV